MLEPKDKYGRSVVVGAKVRIVELSSSFLASLPPDEIEDVRAMIGEVFEVYEIDEYGSPWVEKIWNYPDKNQCSSHSLALDTNEMELVDEVKL